MFAAPSNVGILLMIINKFVSTPRVKHIPSSSYDFSKPYFLNVDNKLFGKISFILKLYFSPKSRLGLHRYRELDIFETRGFL